MIFITLLIICANSFRPFPENKYILLSTSKFWFNVRQAVNSLLIYQQLRQFGITDENIILMIPEDSACNRKNNDPGRICAYDDQQEPNLYKNVQLDYKRNDVNIKYWIDIMRGKYDYYTPQSRRLQLSKENKLIMYINGHGGDGYTKMQDTQYLLDFEMAKITKEMAYLDLYKEAFLISDSCGAVTLYEKVEAPNMILLGSSSVTQKSYSKGKDDKLMMPKSDRFTFVTNEFLQKRVANDVTLTLQDQFDIYDPIEQQANSKLIINMPQKTAKDIKIVDFWRSKPRKYLQVVRRRDHTNKAKQEFLDSLG